MKLLYRILLFTTQLIHHCFVIAFATNTLWFILPPHLAAIILLIAIITAISPYPCILTTLENYLRTKVGLPTIHKFISHYYKNRLHYFK